MTKFTFEHIGDETQSAFKIKASWSNSVEPEYTIQIRAIGKNCVSAIEHLIVDNRPQLLLWIFGGPGVTPHRVAVAAVKRLNEGRHDDVMHFPIEVPRFYSVREAFDAIKKKAVIH